MALGEYLANFQATAEAVAPETPQAQQSQASQQSLTQVTYDNAGQQPPTPSARAFLPHVKGGLVTWLVIVALLWLAWAAYAHSHGSSAKIEITATEG